METARNRDPSSSKYPKAPLRPAAGCSRSHHSPPTLTPAWLCTDPSQLSSRLSAIGLPGQARQGQAGPGGAGRAVFANPAGSGAQSTLTLGDRPPRGTGQGRKLTFRWKHTARRGTPALPEAVAAGSWGGGIPSLVLTPRAPLPPLCLGPPALIPLPWRAPTSCSRARGASVGAPHGDASPPPHRARPAQSARSPHPQRSPAPRGAPAARQRGPDPAGARARPMVPGAPALRLPLPRSFSASTEKKQEKKRDDQTFGGGLLAVPGDRARPGEGAQKAVEAASPLAWGRRGKGRIWGK